MRKKIVYKSRKLLFFTNYNVKFVWLSHNNIKRNSYHVYLIGWQHVIYFLTLLTMFMKLKHMSFMDEWN